MKRSIRRGPLFASAAVTVAFVAFTLWWLTGASAGLDAAVLAFGDWAVRGLVDVFVGDSWFLGEPQVVLGLVIVVALFLASRRRYIAASLIVGGLVVLSAIQLGVFLVAADARHVDVGINTLSHFYPSGHAARVPFMGTTVALVAAPRARVLIVALTALIAVAVAFDRTTSRYQTGSVVVGGLLLGTAVSMWLALLYQDRVGRRRA